MFSRARVAVLTVIALGTTAFVTAPAQASSAASDSGETSVKVYPLFYSSTSDGPVGGTNPVTVRLTKRPGAFRVGFSEDEVAGTGDQWRAAGWGAASVATLLLGSPTTNRQITYELQGAIDGPSAGALMTVATLALLRGDKIKSDITMTGTINPDGTVGPVGGIPYKVDGVKQAKKTKMLIPIGQRNSPDNDGNSVDIVALGRKKGIQVKEVANVYDAYKAFTGKSLPRAKSPDSVAISEKAYGRLKTEVSNWMDKYKASVQDFGALDAEVQSFDDIQSLANVADQQAEQATTLKADGLQAGALTAAINAAAAANAAVRVGQAYQVLLLQGYDAFENQVGQSANADSKIKDSLEELDRYKPVTISDSAALIGAYGNLVDAVSYSQFGHDQFDSISAEDDNATYIQKAVTGAIYLELAGSVADATIDVLDASKGLGGAKVSKKANLGANAAFFRKAAAANMAAFDAVVIGEFAKQDGASMEVEKNAFANFDQTYVLALYGQQFAQGAFNDELSSSASKAYASLGASIALYGRSSGLIAKYYSLGQLDSDGVVQVSSPKALISAINFGQNQLGRAVGVLTAKKVDPTVSVAAYETASISREGETSDKFDALGAYWTAYAEARLLSYLGGFQTAGM